MKKYILILIASVAVLAMPVGCATKASPQRTAFNVESSIITTGEGARIAWGKYYIAQYQALNANPTANAGALAKLEANRNQVNAAWFKYQNAATALLLGQQAGLSNTNGVPSQISDALSAAEQPLINLVTSLIK